MALLKVRCEMLMGGCNDGSCSSRVAIVHGDDGDDYEEYDACDYLIGVRHGTSQEVDFNVGHNGHQGMTKSVSMPLPDPFPGLSQNMTPVSAKIISRLLDSDTSPQPDYPTSLLVNGVSELGTSRVGSSGRGGSPLGGADSPALSNNSADSLDNEFDRSTFPEKTNVEFYNDNQSCHLVTLDGSTSVADVCDRLVELNHTSHDPNWTVVEHLTKFQLERSIDDHELIYQIYRTWPTKNDNRFYFRKDYSKYELFHNPTQFFPESMVDVKLPKEDTSGFLTRSERYKNLLLQNLLANQCMPDIQGFLQIREGKRSWKKYFCVLRSSGLYFSSKAMSKDPQHLVLITHLSNVDIYTSHNAKKVHSAPNNYCFCLKGSQQMVSDPKQLRLLCTENEQSRLCWLMGMRFVKYGAQLRENFRATVTCHSSLKSIENKDKKDADPLYAKSRVAMDFSGQSGRVVADPNEALGVAFEEGQQWRKKAAVRSPVTQTVTSVGQGRDLRSSPVPDLTGCRPPASMMSSIHLTQPWFHGHISREEAVSLVNQQGLVDGVFLVRDSASLPGVHVLSFAHHQKVKHCTIYKMDVGGQIYYSLDGGATKFLDLIQLIEFYQLNAGGLPTHLTHHVVRLL